MSGKVFWGYTKYWEIEEGGADSIQQSLCEKELVSLRAKTCEAEA
jgi:hypothetical protein